MERKETKLLPEIQKILNEGFGKIRKELKEDIRKIIKNNEDLRLK